MYEVFINDRPIYLTNKLTKERDYKLFLLETCNILEIISQLNKGTINTAYLYHPEQDQLIKKLKDKVTPVIAAGGLVRNSSGDVLFIYRNDKWDLPKGKLNKGESIESAAIREVEEETGVKNLKIETFLRKTYHIFKRNGTYRLKETYWYLMNTSYKGKLVPQCDEGIHEAVWKKDPEIKHALMNSYMNIKVLFEQKPVYSGISSL